MTFIVHGATGAQGAPVLNLLAAAGHDVTAAVRDTGRVPVGAAVTAPLDDVEALTAAYRGADGVFVHLPLGATDAHAATVAAAIAAARPARVVISTSGQIVDQPDSPLQAPGESPIATLIREVTQTGVSTAVVAPRLYLENLLLPVVAGPAKAEGVLRYPLPAAFPVSWSSHLDVAEVVVRLLTDVSVTGTVAIGALPGLLGADLAAGFSEHFGIPIEFAAMTPDQFGELITPLFGPAAVGVVGLYRALNAEPANVISSSNSAQELLGLHPRSVATWLRDLGV